MNRDADRARPSSFGDMESRTDEVGDLVKTGKDRVGAEAQVREVLDNSRLTRSTQHTEPRKKAKVRKGPRSARSDGVTAGHALAEVELPLGASRSDDSQDRHRDRVGQQFGTVADFQHFLKSEVDGLTLESRFEGGSLEAQLDQYKRAYADGTLGFAPDLTRLRINMSQERQDEIRSSIETRRITGVVLIAYPHRAQVSSIAERCGVSVEDLLSMPVTEFLARHFLARGGMIHDTSRSIENWRNLKWAAVEGPSLAAIFRATAKSMGVVPGSWIDADGFRSKKHVDVHGRVYQNLPPQPVLGDLLGVVRLVLTNVKRDVGESLSLGERVALTQGAPISHIRLLQANIDMLTPEEYLSFLATSSPSYTDSYPAPHTWEWLASIGPQYAARVDSGAVGLVMREENPAFAGAWNCRVRPVLRA